MQSSAPTVSAYLEEVPPERKAALERLRALCLELLNGYNESMLYGMPCYQHPAAKDPEIAFASQKNHISFYVFKQEVMQANRGLLKGASLGKGCIRYSKPEKINFDVVRKILLETRASSEPIC